MNYAPQAKSAGPAGTTKRAISSPVQNHTITRRLLQLIDRPNATPLPIQRRHLHCYRGCSTTRGSRGTHMVPGVVIMTKSDGNPCAMARSRLFDDVMRRGRVTSYLGWYISYIRGLAAALPLTLITLKFSYVIFFSEMLTIPPPIRQTADRRQTAGVDGQWPCSGG